MIKTALIILSILQMNFAFAQEEAPKIPIEKQEVIDILDPPGTAALNIMLSALSSFKELKKSEGVITAAINPKLSKNLRLRIPSLKGD